MKPDPIAAFNEKLKLRATSLNAIAIGLFGFAFIRPATDDVSLLSFASIAWTLIALVLHTLGAYILSDMRKGA